MNRRAAFNLALTFIVIIVISTVVFTFGLYIIKKFFTHAETIRMVYDERTEKEIERLLDDGSRVAIPFDQKTIMNGEYKTFGIGVLNVLNIGSYNDFNISIVFKRAYDKKNNPICGDAGTCGPPDRWLKTTFGEGIEKSGVHIVKRIRNNEQEKFLLMVEPRSAPPGTYIFDLNVSYLNDTTKWLSYDNMHKLYVNVP